MELHIPARKRTRLTGPKPVNGIPITFTDDNGTHHRVGTVDNQMQSGKKVWRAFLIDKDQPTLIGSYPEFWLAMTNLKEKYVSSLRAKIRRSRPKPT